MKKLATIIVAFATLAFASCSILNNSSDTTAQAAGQTCGAAVLGLYNAYKATGTINLGEANNLTNALALAACYTQIKQNKDNQSYRKSFANGLVLSSAGLITNQNANTFINALILANGLTNISATNTTAQNNTAASSSITNLVGTLEKTR